MTKRVKSSFKKAKKNLNTSDDSLNKYITPLYAVMTGSVGILFIPAKTIGGSTDTTFNVRATIAPSCKFVTASDLDFGDYQNMSPTDLDGSAIFKISCPVGITATIALNDGIHADGPQRRMSDGGNQYLKYDLFTDASRSTKWNASNTVDYSATTAEPQPITIYGRIPTGQFVNHRAYGDIVTITATF